MANFAYTNSTNFRPLSYQEMLAPLLMATQSHQAVEEAYGTLDSQANAIGSLADETNDPVTYARYKNYETALRQQADILAKNGLTPGSRKTLMDLKGRYTSDITPIQAAITRRQALADEQRKALLSNPTLMFQRNMNALSYDSSLDRFLENPDYDYGQVYSGALLTKQVSDAASNLAKELRGYGNGKNLDEFTKTFLQTHGFTSGQVLNAINNPNRATSQPVLNAIVEQVMGSSRMSDWADDDTMRQAYNYARQGLWSAIGQSSVQTYSDYAARLAARPVTQEGLAEQNRLKMYNVNPSSLYGRGQVAAQNKKTADLLNSFKEKGYFTEDGRLSKKGLRILQESKEGWNVPVGSVGYYTPDYTTQGDMEFKKWALEHGITQDNINRGLGSTELNKYYQDTMAKINNGELATGVPNIDVYRQTLRDKTTRDLVADMVSNVIGKNVLIYEVGDLTVDNGKVNMGQGRGVSQSEFKKLVKDNPILYVTNSPVTGNQLIELTDGTKFILPVGILDNINQDNLDISNLKVMNSASPMETAVNLNNANSYLGAILNYNEGTGVSVNDGTITVE